MGCAGGAQREGGDNFLEVRSRDERMVSCSPAAAWVLPTALSSLPVCRKAGLRLGAALSSLVVSGLWD